MAFNLQRQESPFKDLEQAVISGREPYFGF